MTSKMKRYRSKFKDGSGGDEKKKKKKESDPHPIKTVLNPFNWGVEDLSEHEEFGKAYRKARSLGKKEFLWNGKRYNTKYDGTPAEQLRETGITDKDISSKPFLGSLFGEKIYKTVPPTSYPTEQFKDDIVKNFTEGKRRTKSLDEIPSLFKKKDKIKKELKNLNTSKAPKESIDSLKAELGVVNNAISEAGAYLGHDDEDMWKKFLGLPQTNNTLKYSEYSPTRSKEKDAEYFTFSDNEQFRKEVLREAEGSEKFPHVTEMSTRTGLANVTIDKGEDEKGKYYSIYDKYDFDVPHTEAVGTPYEIYDRVYLDSKEDKDMKKYNSRSKKPKKYFLGGNPFKPEGMKTPNGKLLQGGADMAAMIPMSQETGSTDTAATELGSKAVQTGLTAVNPALGAAYGVTSGAGKMLRKNPTKTGGQIASDIIDPTHGIMNAIEEGDPLNAVPVLGGIRRANQAEDELELLEKKKQSEAEKRIAQQSRAELSSFDTQGVEGASFKYGGRAKYGINMANGGKMKYGIDMAHGGKIDNLASDVGQFDGAKHEQGGIKLDLNNDGQPEAEVEDDEVMAGDNILSDRLKPTPDAAINLKESGIRVSPKDTYADVAAKVGKLKGKFEKKMESNDPLAVSTGKLMIDKLDRSMDNLFNDQEASKPVTKEDQEFRRGGTLTDPIESDTTRMKNTDYPDDDWRRWSTVKPMEPSKELRHPDPLGQAGELAVSVFEGMLEYPKSLYNSAKSFFTDDVNKKAYGGKIKEYSHGGTHSDLSSKPPGSRIPGSINFDFMNGKAWPVDDFPGLGRYYTFRDSPVEEIPLDTTKTGSTTNTNVSVDKDKDVEKSKVFNAKRVTPLGLDSIPESVIGKKTLGNSKIDKNRFKKVGEYKGSYKSPKDRSIDTSNFANLGAYLSNQSVINDLETEFNPETVTNPSFRYTDRSSVAENKNAASFRTAMKGVERAGAGSTSNVRADLFAKKLEADNQVNMAENMRRDQALDKYSDSKFRTQAMNAQTRNKAGVDNMSRRNEQKALTQQNVDSFMRGVVGNQAVKDQRQLDVTKALLTAAKDGDRGTVERLFKTLNNPKLKDMLTKFLKDG